MTAAPPRHGAPYNGPVFFEEEPPPKRRKTGRWVIGGFAVLVVLGLLASLTYLFVLQRSYNENVTHFPSAEDGQSSVFPPEEERPADDDALNILLLGSDSGGGSGDNENLPRVPGGGRSDTMMLVHIPESRDAVSVISIPRDLWVEIPGGYGWHKVNAGLALGGGQGPGLTVATIESLFDVRVDHVAAIDMLGFAGLVDSMGGVTVNSPMAFTAQNGMSFAEGPQHMTSEQALAFVRERKAFPTGDLQRIENQQTFIRAVIDQAATPSTLSNPVRVNEMVGTFAQHLITDEELDAGAAASLAWSARGAVNNMQFTTLPTAGNGYSADGQWIFYQDTEAIAAMSQHMKDGTLADYLSQ
ncbi:LCP family protein [Nesterenkonia massiliensis]|uniref:LCP family protein n=1 Tax=Nesterenkonia massiliensis TaxID=1232429 RepID=A0ABT2HMP8_9MICC|nr:LCP family protein [Nesterenkonia massiliensis]MCT1605957.1 LCP family protein [Nesterenkonia massiliensis]